MARDSRPPVPSATPTPPPATPSQGQPAPAQPHAAASGVPPFLLAHAEATASPNEEVIPMDHDHTAQQAPQDVEPACDPVVTDIDVPAVCGPALEVRLLGADDEPVPDEALSADSVPEPTTFEDDGLVLAMDQPGAGGRPPASDEAVALSSLDDTVMRPMPDANVIWAEEERWQRRQQERVPRPHIPTIALVAAVGAVAFVAGGVTARLGAQTPLLFSQQPQATESTASYRPSTPTATLTQTDDETAAPQQTLPDDTAEPQQEQPSHEQPTTHTRTDEQPTDDEQPTYRWDFDSEGDRSISYDTNDDHVTLDYDGYSLTFNLNDLLGTDGTGSDGTDTTQTDPYQTDGQNADPYQTDDQSTTYYDPWQWYGTTDNNGHTTNDTTDDYQTQDYYGTNDQRTDDTGTTYVQRTYDYGTGYDTEEERDQYGWRTPGWGTSTPWGEGAQT